LTGQYPNNPNLRWCELLSRAEIQQWLSTGTVPPRLVVDFDRAGIYRFVFEECRDDTTAHTACYVGETVNLCHRMKDYFPTTPRPGAAPSSQKRLLAGWEVRGRILLSSGNFELQTLKLEGPVTFGGFTFGPENFEDAYDNFFIRRMLESWAVLASEHGDHLYPLNRRGTKAKRIFEDLARKAQRAKRQRRTKP
jgi:hypothetical protein